MFDKRVWVEKPVPIPCRVSISRAFPRLAVAAAPANAIPLWIRTGGVRLEDAMDGELIGWARLLDSQWIAHVRIRPQIGSEIASMTLWVTADAVEQWP